MTQVGNSGARDQSRIRRERQYEPPSAAGAINNKADHWDQVAAAFENSSEIMAPVAITQARSTPCFMGRLAAIQAVTQPPSAAKSIPYAAVPALKDREAAAWGRCPET